MYAALLERRQVLQQQLSHKLQQLRKICLQEAVCNCISPLLQLVTNYSVSHFKKLTIEVAFNEFVYIAMCLLTLKIL